MPPKPAFPYYASDSLPSKRSYTFLTHANTFLCQASKPTLQPGLLLTLLINFVELPDLSQRLGLLHELPALRCRAAKSTTDL